MGCSNLSSGLFGGVIGALIGALAAWWIERAKWARDCRKQEWRELLDAIISAESAATECSANQPQGSFEANFERLDIAIANLIRTTRDRLFLPDDITGAVAVTVAGIKLQISLAGESYARSPTTVLQFVRLREVLTEKATQNLGIARKQAKRTRSVRHNESGPSAHTAASG